MKRITALIAALILFLSLSINVFSAANPIMLKGDADSNGRVNIYDARLVLRLAMGLDDSSSIGRNKFELLNVSEDKKNKLTVADSRTILRVVTGITDYSSLYSEDELINLYNSIANTVKSDQFRTSTKMSVFTIIKTADSLEDLSGSSNTEFSAVTDCPITNENYPLYGYDYVSGLENGDINNMSVDICVNNDLLSDFGEYRNDISWDGNCKNLIAVHAEISETELSTIKQNPSGYIPSYSKAYNIDLTDNTLKLTVEEFTYPELTDFEYTEIAVNLTVDYICKYSAEFASLIPVAAIYRIKTTSDYELSYSIEIPGMNTVTTTENGTATQDKTILYIFDRYIK